LVEQERRTFGVPRAAGGGDDRLELVGRHRRQDDVRPAGGTGDERRQFRRVG